MTVGSTGIPYWDAILSPGCSAFNQLPANAPGRAVLDGSGTSALAAHMGDQDVCVSFSLA